MVSNTKYESKNPKNAFKKQRGVDAETTAPDVVFSRFEPESTARTDIGEEGVNQYLTPQVTAGREVVPSKGLSDYSYVRLPPNVSPDERCSPWYKRGLLQVPAASNREILRIPVNPGTTYYVSAIGHSFINNQFYFELIIDRKLWDRWNYQIGAPAPGSMYKFTCAIAARESVVFKVINPTGVPKDFEVALDGWWTGVAGIGEGKGRE
jgi:hypothetical protein